MEKARRKGYWEEQVDAFCGLFGFRLDVEIGMGRDLLSVRHYLLKSGRSTVAYKDEKRTWRSGELQLGVVAAENRRGEVNVEGAMEKIMRTVSGKELIVRSSGEDRKSPYGFTKVRLIRHIRLPEFGSVEELKLKLAVSGEAEP